MSAWAREKGLVWRDQREATDPTREATRKKGSWGGWRKEDHQPDCLFLTNSSLPSRLTFHQIELGKKRGIEGRKKKRRSEAVPPCCRPWSPTCCSPTPRCLPPLNHHQIEAGDWGERAGEPDRRREREKRAPRDWWRRPIHRSSPTTTPTCCTSSSSTSRNRVVDPLQLGFADRLRPCCSPSPTTSTAQETTMNLSSLNVVFWIFALNILQLVIWISVNYWCVREKTRWFNL